MLSEAVLTEIQPEDLPAELRKISDVIGINATLQLVEAMPGQLLRLPRMPRAGIARSYIDRHPELSADVLAKELHVSVGFVEAVRAMAGNVVETLQGEIAPFDMPTIARIVIEVCRICSVSEEELASQRREQRISWARQLAMYLIRTMIPRISLEGIGLLFGGRDHSTVIYSIERATDTIATHREIADTVSTLKATILERLNHDRTHPQPSPSIDPAPPNAGEDLR